MDLEEFKSQLQIGTKILLPPQHTGHDLVSLLPSLLEYEVAVKRKYTVELHHIIRNNKLAGISIYSPNYATLYLLTHGQGGIIL